jgi:multicomponent Na+:H+ antiporter subunit D
LPTWVLVLANFWLGIDTRAHGRLAERLPGAARGRAVNPETRCCCACWCRCGHARHRRSPGTRPNLREGITLLTAATLLGSVLAVLAGYLHGDVPTVVLAEPLPGLPLSLRPNRSACCSRCSRAGCGWSRRCTRSATCAPSASRTRRASTCASPSRCSAPWAWRWRPNLLTLFVFYEVLTLSTYPLVAHAGTPEAVRGARTYLGILLATSIGLFLPAIVWTYSLAGTLEFTPAACSRARRRRGGALLLGLFVLGVGKAAVMPVHRWLPAAMVAPTPVSALLHAVAVVKAGVFTITKVVIYIFGLDFLAGVPAERVARLPRRLHGHRGLGGRAAPGQPQALLAYSTIGQLSYVVIAAMVLTPLAEIGAAIHIVAHGFGKITLFFTAGAIYVASGKTRVSELDGIGRRMPWTMAAFAVGALSMVGVPPTAGFVSKWYIIAGAFQNDLYFVLMVLIVSTGLNAAYFLPVIHRAFFRSETVAPKYDHGEAPWPMVAALVRRPTLTVAFFVFNGPVVDLEKSIVGNHEFRRCAPPPRTDPPRHWLAGPGDDPRAVDRVHRGAGAHGAAELLVHLHPRFRLERWFGFHAAWGFLSCVAMVLFANLLGLPAAARTTTTRARSGRTRGAGVIELAFPPAFILIFGALLIAVARPACGR